MTVSTTTNKVSYIGNGIATTFAIPFPFLEEEHLKVWQLLNDIQTERTDWTVSGGNMVFATAPAENAQIVIMREVPLTQETDYRENEILPAETLERNFDKLTMQVQQLKEQADRAVTVDVFDDTDAASLIPSIRQAVSDCAEYAVTATQKVQEAITQAQTALNQAQNAATSATNVAASGANTAVMLETKANIDADNLSQQGKSNLIALSSLAMNRVVDYIFGTLTDTMQYYTTPVNGYIHIEYDGNNEVYFSANGVAFGTAGSTVGAARRLTSPLFKKGTVVGAQVASGTVVLPHNFFNYANGEV